MANINSTQLLNFQKRLKNYKKLIDDDISAYAKIVQKSTLQQYGAEARLATDAYLSILGRGGKRIRGALTMAGYHMCDGQDKNMILQAARVIEMMHAYVLILDDIQDRSETRRGDKSAHIMLRDYHHKQQFGDDSGHFGVSLAINSALVGSHAAQMTLANLNVPDDIKIKALSILNRTMIVTAHGQTNDIINEVVAEVDEAAIERVLEWKTAHYTILNPLHIGMVLAGAGCEDTDAITDYATHTGIAFQITDDIIGVFGNEQNSGKSPMDDTKEGKQTVLSVFALKHANDADKNFLLQMLGNHQITLAEFDQVKNILIKSGALKHAQDRSQNHINLAIKSLDLHASRWPKKDIDFLRQLALAIPARTN
ncbi:MAG: polyprenyl synthetase family protein [Patescibacteria group bacterium]